MESSQPILACADAFRAIYPNARQQWIMGLSCMAICGPTFLLGDFLDKEWIGVFAITLCAGLFVVPHVMRVRSFLATLPCGSCGQAAGRHTTKKGILHLQCEHCGHLTRTDCLMLGPGKPTRI